MNLDNIRSGMEVRTNSELGGTEGMLIAEKHLKARQPFTDGVVTGYVAGHGGDVWWIKHPDGSIGAYMFDEFERI